MNKQIEEMAKVIFGEFDGMIDEANATTIAAHLVRSDYRKSEDVARELGELIKDEIYMTLRAYCNMDAICLIDERIDEAVKKYESEGE